MKEETLLLLLLLLLRWIRNVHWLELFLSNRVHWMRTSGRRHDAADFALVLTVTLFSLFSLSSSLLDGWFSWANFTFSFLSGSVSRWSVETKVSWRFFINCVDLDERSIGSIHIKSLSNIWTTFFVSPQTKVETQREKERDEGLLLSSRIRIKWRWRTFNDEEEEEEEEEDVLSSLCGVVVDRMFSVWSVGRRKERKLICLGLVCHDGSNPCELDEESDVLHPYFLPSNGYHCLETLAGHVTCTCPNNTSRTDRPCRTSPSNSSTHVDLWISCRSLWRGIESVWNELFSFDMYWNQSFFLLSLSRWTRTNPTLQPILWFDILFFCVREREEKNLDEISSSALNCRNGGIEDRKRDRCHCPSGFNGARCQLTSGILSLFGDCLIVLLLSWWDLFGCSMFVGRCLWSRFSFSFSLSVFLSFGLPRRILWTQRSFSSRWSVNECFSQVCWAIALLVLIARTEERATNKFWQRNGGSSALVHRVGRETNATKVRILHSTREGRKGCSLEYFRCRSVGLFVDQWLKKQGKYFQCRWNERKGLFFTLAGRKTFLSFRITSRRELVSSGTSISSGGTSLSTRIKTKTRLCSWTNH